MEEEERKWQNVPW